MRTYRLPSLFTEDHFDRYYAIGGEREIIHCGRNHWTIRLSNNARDNLQQDAEYYADLTGAPDCYENMARLVRSAKRTLQILQSTNN